MIYMLKGAFRRAAAAFADAVARHAPGDAEAKHAHYLHASALHELKKYGAAEEALAKALAIDDAFFGAHYGLSETRLDAGDVKGAITAVQDCLRLASVPVSKSTTAFGLLSAKQICWIEALSLGLPSTRVEETPSKPINRPRGSCPQTF